MSKIKLATTWLDGCAGCHMSLLDVDEGILALLEVADIVYGPLVDIKQYPEGVDVALVEGAASSEEDVELLHTIRERTRIVVALGDCAVTSNVPSMRNQFGVGAIMRRAYFENADAQAQQPADGVPALLSQARPIHSVIKVDYFLPGCPPSAALILQALTELCAGRLTEPGPLARFG